ncbi:orotidine-5'-phosphate decarboxylase [Hippea maritima]|uniref:Orotidine 5'-phosphate decarboxylase n=1 Tax=Hippea maritima (strain ATCC 700847 / DSM 10411 / MH2) TaxID=760142 RepID=F2LY76_HIPMA|nr:orotidine-5'-phosphate decarboxylase [Hippea maritima]AEA34399.1 orotidine 5'-phosphate decarboxylase [Hippea maritima DSM 10411]
MSNKIIVALDLKGLDNILRLVDTLENALWFKVGAVNFTAYGIKLIEELKKRNKKVFLDLKYHDIPNTTKEAVYSAAELGVDMLTIHSIGGTSMMKAAADAIREFEQKEGKKGPLILAVTVLTSIDNDALKEDMFINDTVENTVLKLASKAMKSSINGLVASAKETKMLREKFGNYFTIVTPGIRPSWSAKQDQKRITTPSDAIKLGSDFMVIGRPIYKAENPKEAFEKIRKETENVNPR